MVSELDAGVPSIADLLRTIRDSLHAEVLPATTDRAQYVVRMTCRLLDIVEREIAAGDADPTQLSERLRSLGATSEAELASGLMSGTIDPADPAVRDFIRDLVRWRIDVARPDHPDAGILTSDGAGH